MRMPVGLRSVGAALAGVLLLGVGQSLSAATVTVYSNNTSPGDWETGPKSPVSIGSSGWVYDELRQDGAIGISTRGTKDFNANGSVWMETTTTLGMAQVELLNANGFGKLGDLETFSFSWYRDSASDAAAYAGPVARLLITNGTNTGYLIWEQSYNGYRYGPLYAAPVDEWITTNTLNDGNGHFSTYSAGAGKLVKSGFGGADATFNDWLNGSKSWMLDSNGYADYTIVGINMGIGSGLGDTLIGGVDNLTIGFKGFEATTYDFAVRPVPEPSSIALSVIGGAGLLAAAYRRRRAATA